MVRQSLAKADHRRVNGGGHVGLMSPVADGCLKAAGKVIGVMPHALVDREIAHTGLAELILANDMDDRKAKMAERADAFVVLPGGSGTLEGLCCTNHLMVAQPLTPDGFSLRVQ